MAITKVTRTLLSTGIDDQSNATAITIDSSENVGIGTASPAQKLHVSGNVYVGAGNYFTDSTSGYFFGGNGSFTNGVYGVGTNNMAFNVNGSERMRIDSSGNVGIGTSSPNSYSGQTALTINSPSVARLDLDIGDTRQGYLLAESGYTGLFADSGNNLRLGAGGSERVRIDSSGNVGIGTTSPSYPLHVDRGATGDIAHFEGQGSTHLRIGEASNVMYLSANNGSAEIAFQSNGSEKMRIRSTGVINSPPTYAQTTSNSANMVVRSGGDFERSTSSERYKNSITDATKGLAELKTLRPVNYKGNNDGDTVFYGLIAEEVHDAGLTEFVEYDDENQPDALRYPHMVSLCVKAIQEQQAIIDNLKTRIETLESA